MSLGRILAAPDQNFFDILGGIVTTDNGMNCHKRRTRVGLVFVIEYGKSTWIDAPQRARQSQCNI
jgi:hypothetical protein